MSRGAAEGADIIESGGGMSVIWQCGLESVLSRGENIYFSRHIIHYDQLLVPHLKD